VNELRTGRGLPAVELDEVAAIDRCSTGHVDWFEKFAWRCAELSVGAEWRR
jgi:hypothetical protein